ncbi:hypothetical protein LAUMK142_01221 [Mycobacterium pseudokansasii]|uniref:Uncharacterized protein n=1 Tax=Mycobacterium pseudokansasii TaxID=2341080 RepID=A0A498QNC2_9MYCO|nr:hypothetical protein LAUMK142_01221 [Mycobacterium pseudokansasii]
MRTGRRHHMGCLLQQRRRQQLMLGIQRTLADRRRRRTHPTPTAAVRGRPTGRRGRYHRLHLRRLRAQRFGVGRRRCRTRPRHQRRIVGLRAKRRPGMHHHNPLTPTEPGPRAHRLTSHRHPGRPRPAPSLAAQPRLRHRRSPATAGTTANTITWDFTPCAQNKRLAMILNLAALCAPAVAGWRRYSRLSRDSTNRSTRSHSRTALA